LSPPSQPSSLHRYSADVIAVAGLAALLLALAVATLLPRTLPAALLVLLWLGSGLCLGFLEVILVVAVHGVGGRAERRLRPRLPRLAAWALPLCVALLTVAAWLALGRQMFSGAGIRRSPLAPVGPALVTIAGSGAVLAATRLWLVWRGKSRRARAIGAGVGLLFGLAVLAAGTRVIPHNYGYLWDAAALASFACFQAAWHLACPRTRLGGTRATAVIMAMTLLAVLGAVRWPVPSWALPALHDDDHPTGRLAAHWRRIIDMDADGVSPVLGGGDCNDLDERIQPLALDLPEDGIDQDCDGVDMTRQRMQALQSFWSGHRWARPAASAGPGSLARASVVLITVDALRADNLRPSSGRLGELWRSSVRFDHAYAPSSSTWFSLPIMMTSRLAPSGGSAAPTLAARLQAAGFRTGLVSHAVPVEVIAEKRVEMLADVDLAQGRIELRRDLAPLFDTRPPFDLKQGFDRVELVPEGANDRGLLGMGRPASRDAQIADRALALAAQLAASPEPIFLWVHFFDLHQWPHVVAGQPGESAAAHYGRAVAQTLAEVERLLTGLDAILASRPTVTLLSADHGEALGERGYRHHTRFLYDFLVRVPLLFRAPNVPPEAISEPVSLLDVVPTLLELAGINPCADCSGDSLVALLGAKDRPPRRAVLLRDSDQVALITDGWKLLFSPRANTAELYPLDDERPNAEASAARPEVARELMGLLRLSPLRKLPPLRAASGPTAGGQ
jgi:arylsulfatase A-like enzyme